MTVNVTRVVLLRFIKRSVLQTFNGSNTNKKVAECNCCTVTKNSVILEVKFHGNSLLWRHFYIKLRISPHVLESLFNLCGYQ